MQKHSYGLNFGLLVNLSSLLLSSMLEYFVTLGLELIVKPGDAIPGEHPSVAHAALSAKTINSSLATSEAVHLAVNVFPECPLARVAAVEGLCRRLLRLIASFVRCPRFEFVLEAFDDVVVVERRPGRAEVRAEVGEEDHHVVNRAGASVLGHKSPGCHCHHLFVGLVPRSAHAVNGSDVLLDQLLSQLRFVVCLLQLSDADARLAEIPFLGGFVHEVLAVARVEGSDHAVGCRVPLLKTRNHCRTLLAPGRGRVPLRVCPYGLPPELLCPLG